jgi:hypothetical protein
MTFYVYNFKQNTRILVKIEKPKVIGKRFYASFGCDLTRILGKKNIWEKLFGEKIRFMVNNSHVHREDIESIIQNGRTRQNPSNLYLFK